MDTAVLSGFCHELLQCPPGLGSRLRPVQPLAQGCLHMGDHPLQRGGIDELSVRGRPAERWPASGLQVQDDTYQARGGTLGLAAVPGKGTGNGAQGPL